MNQVQVNPVSIPSFQIESESLGVSIEPTLNAVQDGEGSSLSLFSRGVQVFKDCQVYPFDVFIGVNFIFATLLHIKTFVDTFREYVPHVTTVLLPVQKTWDKMRIRVVSSLNTIGSLSRLLDWAHDRGYFLFNAVQSLGLKLIGSFTGVVNFGYKTIESLQKIKELDRLAEFGKRLSLCREADFNAYWYAVYCSFVANFNFMLYSGLQLGSILTGVSIAVEVSSVILTIASVMLIASLVFQMTDESGYVRDCLRSYDEEGRALGVDEYSLVRHIA